VAGRPLHTFEVVSTEQLTRHMLRVVLGGSGFDTFTPSEFTDSYVKFAFIRADIDVTTLPQPLTLDSFAGLPPEHQPTVAPTRCAAPMRRPGRSPSTSSSTASTAWPARGRWRHNPATRRI